MRKILTNEDYSYNIRAVFRMGRTHRAFTTQDKKGNAMTESSKKFTDVLDAFIAMQEERPNELETAKVYAIAKRVLKNDAVRARINELIPEKPSSFTSRLYAFFFVRYLIRCLTDYEYDTEVQLQQLDGYIRGSHEYARRNLSPIFCADDASCRESDLTFLDGYVNDPDPMPKTLSSVFNVYVRTFPRDEYHWAHFHLGETSFCEEMDRVFARITHPTPGLALNILEEMLVRFSRDTLQLHNIGRAMTKAMAKPRLTRSVYFSLFRGMEGLTEDEDKALEITPALLELSVPSDPITDGSVPVRWRITQAMRDIIALEDAKKVKALVVVAPEGKPHLETRKVVPFTDAATYVSFRTPGVNHIFVTLLWGEIASPRSYLSRDLDGYRITVAQQMSDDSMDFASPRDSHGRAIISVNVPEGVFAPAKTGRFANFVNRLFNGPPRDECEYKERLILTCAFVIPFALFASAVVGAALLMTHLFGIVLFLVQLSLGVWNPAVKHVFHPFNEEGKYDPRTFLKWRDASSHSILRVPFRGKHYGFLMPFAPIFVIPIWFLALNVHAPIPALMIALKIVARFSAVLLAFTLCAAIINFIHAATKKWLAQPAKTKVNAETKKAEPPRTPWYEEPEFVSEVVVCDTTGATRAVIQPLPERKTIRLRYEQTKAKICRPIAR